MHTEIGGPYIQSVIVSPLHDQRAHQQHCHLADRKLVRRGPRKAEHQHTWLKSGCLRILKPHPPRMRAL